LFSAIFSFALFAIGTFSDDLRNFAAAATGITRVFAIIAANAVPNLASLNIIGQAAHQQSIPGSLVLYNTLYALLYSAGVIAAAVLIFERRNLK